MLIIYHPQYPKHLWDDSVSHNFTFHKHVPLCQPTTNNSTAAFASATLVFKAASPQKDMREKGEFSFLKITRNGKVNAVLTSKVCKFATKLCFFEINWLSQEIRLRASQQVPRALACHVCAGKVHTSWRKKKVSEMMLSVETCNISTDQQVLNKES